MRANRLGGLSPQLVTVFVLVAVASASWLLYSRSTSSNTAYLVRRNSRVLTTLAEAAKKSIAARATRLARDAALVRLLSDNAPPMSGGFKQPCGSKKGAEKGGCLVATLRQSRADEGVRLEASDALAEIEGRCIQAGFEGKDVHLKLLDRCRPLETLLAEEITPLPALLEPYLIGGPFDAVVVLAEDSAAKAGRVVAVVPTAAPIHRLVTWDALGAPRAPTPGPPEPARVVRTGAEQSEVHLAGDRYKVFTLPVEVFEEAISAPRLDGWADLEKGPPLRITIQGLVSAERFEAEGRAFSPFVVLVLSALPLLGVLAWPVLNFFLPDATDRWRAGSLAWLGVSLVVAASVVALAALVYGFHQESLARLDAELGTIATDISSQFATDLDRAFGSIDGAFEEIRDALGGMAIPCADEPNAEVSSARTFLASSRQGRYSLQVLTLVDATGQQRIKWVYSPEPEQEFPAPLQDVASRTYFKAVKDGRLWPWDNRTGFVLEPVWSMSTARFQPILAMPEPGDRKSCSVVAGVRLPSVDGPVLPPGFGFAIIDDQGRVQFHSDLAHTLSENLFEEIQPVNALHLALANPAKSGVFVGRYWGSRHHFLVRPLGPPGRTLPVALVVFADVEPVSARDAELLYATSVWMAGLFLALCLWGLLGWWVLSPRTSWLAPRRTRLRCYPWLALLHGCGALLIWASASLDPAAHSQTKTLLGLALAVALLSTGLAAWCLSDAKRGKGTALGLLFLTLLLPLAVVSLTYEGDAVGKGSLGHGGTISLLVAGMVLAAGAALRVSGRPPDPTSPNSGADPLRTWWLVWAVSLVVALGAAPAVALFRASWAEDQRFARSHGREDMLCRAESRQNALAKELWHSSPPAEPSGAVPDLVATYGCSIGPRPSPDTDEALPLREPLGEESWIARALGPERARLRTGLASAETCPKTAQEPLRAIADCSESATLGEGQGLSLGLRVSLPMAGFVGLAGLGWLLFRLYDRLTSAVAVAAAGPAPVTFGRLEIDRYLFVVCPLLGPRQQLLSQSGLREIDLDSDAGIDALKALAADPGGSWPAAGPEQPPQALCLDRIERACKDAWKGPEVLEALETLLEAWSRVRQAERGVALTGSPNVVLLSEVPPEGLAEGSDAASLRWARVLARFEPCYLPILSPAWAPGDSSRGGRPGFESTLAQEFQEASAKSRTTPTTPTALLEVLAEECHSHRTLREVARGVLRERPELAAPDAWGLVGERAANFYRALWKALTPPEQVVLSQVAAGDVVNPRMGATLSRLRSRGLVRIDEDGPRIFNETFTAFVSSAFSPAEEKKWIRKEAPGPWPAVRGLVFVGLGLAAVFVVVTQRTAAAPFVGLLNALIPLLTKIGDVVRVPGSGSREGTA